MFKKHMRAFAVHGKPGKIQRHQGKGSTQEDLASSDTPSSITGGSPAARSMNDYLKDTPSIQDASSSVGSPPQMASAAGGPPSGMDDGDEDDLPGASPIV